MSAPSWLKRMFGPIPDPDAPPEPDPVETTRTVRRIGICQITDTGTWARWLVTFEDDPANVVEISCGGRPKQGNIRQMTLAKPGDRLRMVHVGIRLVEVEIIDF